MPGNHHSAVFSGSGGNLVGCAATPAATAYAAVLGPAGGSAPFAGLSPPCLQPRFDQGAAMLAAMPAATSALNEVGSCKVSGQQETDEEATASPESLAMVGALAEDTSDGLLVLTGVLADPERERGV